MVFNVTLPAKVYVTVYIWSIVTKIRKYLRLYNYWRLNRVGLIFNRLILTAQKDCCEKSCTAAAHKQSYHNSIETSKNITTIEKAFKTIPVFSICFCSMKPVPYTKAFGGVAIGSINAQLAAKPIPKTIAKAKAGLN